jgi:hypothetical protein
MGTEDESQLTLQGRAAAAAGAALVAACIVNPLDVIKVRVWSERSAADGDHAAGLAVVRGAAPIPPPRTLLLLLRLMSQTSNPLLLLPAVPPSPPPRPSTTQTRIQAQAMAESLGQKAACSSPWTCSSTLYE